MQKNSTTINLTKAARDYLVYNAVTLGLTSSSYAESVLMTHAFSNGYIPTASELENLRKSFLVNGASNITGDFRNQILTFDPLAQASIIAFFYRLNLVKGFHLSTSKMANLFKNDEICYFALGKMGRSSKLVNDYIRSFSLSISTLGTTTAPDNEYLFFSNYQQFKVNKPYPLFPDLLTKLGLPPTTNIIRVHYTQLSLISDAIAQI